MLWVQKRSIHERKVLTVHLNSHLNICVSNLRCFWFKLNPSYSHTSNYTSKRTDRQRHASSETGKSQTLMDRGRGAWMISLTPLVTSGCKGSEVRSCTQLELKEEVTLSAVLKGGFPESPREGTPTHFINHCKMEREEHFYVWEKRRNLVQGWNCFDLLLTESVELWLIKKFLK